MNDEDEGEGDVRPRPSAGSATPGPPRPSHLNGRDAASFLGVKRETLYAYASRGQLRSEPGDHGRSRRYRTEDVERLKARHDARSGHGPVAAGALRHGEPVLESAITAIDARGPIYRGEPAVVLARAGIPFEAVAELLWTGTLPEGGRFRARELGVPSRSLAQLLPANALPLSRLELGVAAIGARAAASPTSESHPGRALLVRLAALLGIGADPNRAGRALRAPSIADAVLMAFGVCGGEEERRAVDCALVLTADHELAPSTFAVRVTASAGADLYACVRAGLAALSGDRHGGVTARVEALVRGIGKPEGLARALRESSRDSPSGACAGERLYPAGDPRTAPLLDHAQRLGKGKAVVRSLFSLLAAAQDAGHPPPVIDYGLVAVSLALGLPVGAATALYAVGRAAGWIAHVEEQRAAGFVLRPRARYVGR